MTRADYVNHDSVELQSVSDSIVNDQAPINAAQAFSEGTYRTFTDGGFEAWSVVTGSSIVYFWFIGIMFSWGVIQDYLIAEEVGSPALLALIGSLGAGLEVILAVPSSWLCAKFGNQKTAFLGSFLVGLGVLLTSWTTHSLPGLFITMGAIFGPGASLCFISSGPLPSQYFKKKRGIATGITFAFGGLGGFAITLALSGLIQRIGLPWALRTLALASWATCLPATYFMKPRFVGRDAGVINLSLFRNTSFLLLFVAGLLGMFPLFTIPFFLPTYARAIGLPSSTGAWLLAGYNLASAFGRLLFGLLSDTMLGPINALFVTSALMSLSMLTSGRVLNGMAAGGFFSCFTPVVGAIFTSSPVTTTLSLLITGWSFGYLTGGPISGALVDASGGSEHVTAYRPAIVFAGGLGMMSSALIALVRYRQSGKLMSKM